MDQRTKSEQIFERFCTEAGLGFRRMPTDERGKTPDYELLLQDPPILTEVKQIDPNALDKIQRRQLEDEGVGFSFRGEPGKRLRDKISAAGAQLRAKIRPVQPGIVVFYNNVCVLRFTDPVNVMAAMYGQLEFVLALPRGGGRAECVGRRLGAKQKLTPQHNTTISAVCILFEGPKGPHLVAYHNRYAANPIDPTVLRNSRVIQFVIDDPQPGEEFPTWRQL
jgi:hypothetical protein